MFRKLLLASWGVHCVLIASKTLRSLVHLRREAIAFETRACVWVREWVGGFFFKAVVKVHSLTSDVYALRVQSNTTSGYIIFILFYKM